MIVSQSCKPCMAFAGRTFRRVELLYFEDGSSIGQPARRDIPYMLSESPGQTAFSFVRIAS